MAPRWGAGDWKVQASIRSLEFPTPPPILQRGKGLEMELISDHAYVRSRHRISTLILGLRELPGWQTHPHREADTPSSLGTEAPVLRTLADLALCTSLYP